jgi:hypothetical protein
MGWFHISWIVVALVAINGISAFFIAWMNAADQRIPNDPKKLATWLANRRGH